MFKHDEEDFDIIDPDFDFEYDDDETFDREEMITSRSEERSQGFVEFSSNRISGYNFPDWKEKPKHSSSRKNQ